jgi:hypothetical protein
MLHLINTLQNMFTNLTTDFSSQNTDASEEERLSSLNAVPYRFHYDDTNHNISLQNATNLFLNKERMRGSRHE